jgi:hypothetical protein
MRNATAEEVTARDLQLAERLSAIDHVLALLDRPARPPAGSAGTAGPAGATSPAESAAGQMSS